MSEEIPKMQKLGVFRSFLVTFFSFPCKKQALLAYSFLQRKECAASASFYHGWHITDCETAKWNMASSLKPNLNHWLKQLYS